MPIYGKNYKNSYLKSKREYKKVEETKVKKNKKIGKWRYIRR